MFVLAFGEIQAQGNYGSKTLTSADSILVINCNRSFKYLNLTNTNTGASVLVTAYHTNTSGTTNLAEFIMDDTCTHYPITLPAQTGTNRYSVDILLNHLYPQTITIYSQSCKVDYFLEEKYKSQ